MSMALSSADHSKRKVSFPALLWKPRLNSAGPQCPSLCSANSDVMWFKWYVWGSNLNLLAISGLCNCAYSHQTLEQWLHRTKKTSASPLSASAAATFREKAGPVQLFSASPRSLPSATFGGDFCYFGVRQGGKSLHFR